MNDFIYRQHIQHSDIGAIADIVKSSGFFSAEEIEIALELAEEKLTQPHDCSYQFVFAEDNKRVVGYTCYGLIPATHSSYDIYWIAVLKEMRSKGLGKLLMAETEKIIRSSGGRQVYVETSSRHQYQPTHGFYESCGYQKEAFLKNFYHEGDGKIIYAKTL
ncbi:MAG: GNAT family N-acetyltransferase [Deltaproteobacteria bacterium]|nr:GNAT family N-acetyltransferase [Deltaproteobacteria bacterium]